MLILALDPGTTETGYVRFGAGSGAVYSSGVVSNADALNLVRDEREAHALAVEMIASYGMPVGREVFETCVFIGECANEWRRHGKGEARFIYRRDVKLHLCGSVKAKDPNVRQALLDMFGGSAAIGKKAAPGPLYGVKSHAWAALGVAVTAANFRGRQ